MSSTNQNDQPLTDEERRLFDMQRRNFFKGTIAIIVIYGSILLLLSLAGLFSEKARKLIFEDGFAFTVTLMSGIILIVILLLIQVFTYKFDKKTERINNNTVCPEYWNLKKTPQDELDKITDPVAKSLSVYYCEKPGASKNTINVSGIPADASTELKEVKNIANIYNNITGLATTQKMTCDRFYPDYMAYVDKKAFPNLLNSNKVRCEYVKHCADATSQGQQGSTNTEKIVWTAVCPNH